MKLAHIVVASFLALLAVEPLLHAASDVFHRQRPKLLQVFLQAPSESNLRTYETALEDSSPLVERARPAMQRARLQLLHDGGEKTLVGADGWMYYKPAVQYLAGGLDPGQWAEALEAVADFQRQLAARGVVLLVVPVPDKASIVPQFLNGRLEGASLETPGEIFAQQLEQQGIPVVHLFSALSTEGKAAYLILDTHWTPAGMEAAVAAVARRVRQVPGLHLDVVQYQAVDMEVARGGDLLRMVESNASTASLPSEKVTTRQIRTGEGAPFKPQAEAEILVLGDSFLRIYEQDDPRSAGFVAHLAHALGAPVSAIISDGGAANLVREQLARQPGLLKGKRVVIWEFAERDLGLAVGGWKKVQLDQTE